MKLKATFEIEANLWKEFIIYAKTTNTTASTLLRNRIRELLGRPLSEMEKVKEVKK